MAERQRRQPSKGYTAKGQRPITKAEKNQRTKCLCVKPNIIRDNDGRVVCFKCGKAP